VKEALEMAREAIEGFIECMVARGEKEFHDLDRKTIL
jgi:hypothetical protein